MQPIHFLPQVKSGSSGDAVTAAQLRLNKLGSIFDQLEADGKFGPKTKARVISFQQNYNLVPDGIVGPCTWGALIGLSPELGMPKVKPAPAPAPEPVAAPKTGYLYLLDGPSYLSETASGKFPKRSVHMADACHYVLAQPNMDPSMAVTMGKVADAENLSIREIIISGHSGGAGVLHIGGHKMYMGGATSLFRYVKPRLAKDCIIWIFACSFATPNDQVIDTDHDVIWPDEMLEGAGTKAMQAIAAYTNCEVRAGFGYQTKNFEHFTAQWCSVSPNGAIKLHYFGRTMSFRENISHKRDAFLGVINKAKYWLSGDGF